MVRGPKKHLKRLNAPYHWMLDKLSGIFVSLFYGCWSRACWRLRRNSGARSLRAAVAGHASPFRALGCFRVIIAHEFHYLIVQAPKPSAGPHKQRECLPLLLILRNRLK